MRQILTTVYVLLFKLLTYACERIVRNLYPKDESKKKKNINKNYCQ